MKPPKIAISALSTAFAAAFAAAALCGCCVEKPAALKVAGGSAELVAGEDSAAFLDRVASGTAVTENDAFRGALMLVDGKDAAATFQDRAQALADRGIVSRSWEFGSHRPLTKGRLAYMVYQACGMKGGLTLLLAGPSQRYCLRELQYRGLMTDGGCEYTEISGMEYVAVITRADAIIREGKLPVVMTDTRNK